MKLLVIAVSMIRQRPAAFRRLCVETHKIRQEVFEYYPAAFRRLCVETIFVTSLRFGRTQPPSGGCVLKLRYGAGSLLLSDQPPSGGCVLKHKTPLGLRMRYSSRLQAAVC